ncbi:hypothetical protein KFL_001570020 [Klebsormidium nitens]|uniref:F-box domain-containing protein n=1 Tax=Klebsormidium nitens TaxID=105231 RepID=A0A0U9HJS5_KLENI|nr:hypothetical protein KFL_001570020 [Klebsormidium nitens]|eukprot:GAQ83663.1 hypothetical protein KFL_001570020 [Klebsormidium nitens]
MAPFPLSEDLLELVLAKLLDAKVRDSCSLVCRAFRAAERRTRHSLRLHCMKRQIEHTPTCFQWVTSLDISDIVPRDRGASRCTFEQFSHLGRCFPTVRMVTCYDGRNFAGTGPLPFGGVWPDLQEVLFKDVSCPVDEDQASSLLERAGRGPLIVTDLHKPPNPGRVGLLLKEVHFVQFVGDSLLKALANASLSSLETINLQLENSCSLYLLLQVLSVESCPWLRTLNLEVLTWGDDSDSESTDEDKPELFTDANLGMLFAQLPLLTALEQLSLFGLSDVSLDWFCRQLTSILGDCRNLRSLYVDLWCEEGEISHQEAKVVLESIAKAAPPTLTHLNLTNSRVIPVPSGRRIFELGTAFWPFNQLLTRLDCSFFASAERKYRFTGWDRLEHLTLGRESVVGLLSYGTQLVIVCPSLKIFGFETDFYVNLTFEGKHDHLATLNICMRVVLQT